MAEQAQRLLAPAWAADSARLGLGEDLRALALINLGIAELWTGRFEDADRHLEQGIALARRIGRPFLELTGLAHCGRPSGFHGPMSRVGQDQALSSDGGMDTPG